jgi:hypothetical protein
MMEEVEFEVVSGCAQSFFIYNRWQQEMKMWYPAISRTNLE